ncbi:MAG: threonine ammonia-lyase [Flammeovirgaceae bacterium]|nr:threonine ammonia-lyase [Flammeovirgaceae bacterium]MDW8287230.1 threonine ammonia-lyase [Flammeovirgaceae bacterium]
MKKANTSKSVLLTVEGIIKASIKLRGVVNHTPLHPDLTLSARYDANIFLKREDLQLVRSYKIRGAYNKMASLTREELSRGVVCASAGNHAQGVAYACRSMKVQGTIFMPNTTPKQKVSQVRMFGGEFVEVRLQGDTFDDSYEAAVAYCEAESKTFIHPFNDDRVMEGQGTVGMEILDDARVDIDYLFVPIGGGGLLAGIGSYFKQISPQTRIIGVEPEGAPAMKVSLEKGENTTLEKIDKFVDGAAVKRVGDKCFAIAQQVLDDIILVPEGKVCTTILNLYNQEAIVVEPAGALSVAALDFYSEHIKGKNVVCIVSGSNNDITRMEEIKERSLLYEGLKYYFIINFPQRAGSLKEFLNNVLGPTDDIVFFEYKKKVNREKGPALVGLELQKKEDLQPILEKLEKQNISYELLNQRYDLYNILFDDKVRI